MSNEVSRSSDQELPAAAKEGKNMAILLCWILGNGCLFPWNSMLTIQDYYTIIFPKYHPTRVLTLVYQPFAFLVIALLAYHEARINTRVRNLAGYTLCFLASLLVLVLDVGTGGRGGVVEFVGVCFVSAIFGVADAHAQGGMVGDLSLMHPQLLQSYLAGTAASGALTSILRMITRAAFQDSQDGLRKGALTFFAISCIFELICVLIYALVFPKLPIVRYYRSKAAAEGSKTVSADLAAAGMPQNDEPQNDEERSRSGSEEEQTKRLTSKQLLAENKDYAFDLFMIFTLTLSIFPGFLSEDTGSHSLGAWYALVLITMFNVWDLVGRYTPMVPLLRFKSRKVLLVATLLRLLLVPAFYFTAKHGGQGYMIFLTSFLGLSNGHLTVCVLTAAPEGYNGPEQNALGNILVFFLAGGLFSGVMLDWLWLIGKGW